jgi:hypothetical protein
MQDGTTPHSAKETMWALCSVFQELMGRIELLARVCASLYPQIYTPVIFICGKNSVVYANNPHDLEALKQNIH